MHLVAMNHLQTRNSLLASIIVLLCYQILVKKTLAGPKVM